MGFRELAGVAAQQFQFVGAVQQAVHVARFGPLAPNRIDSIDGAALAKGVFQRIDDAQACLVITSDGGYRRGAASPLKPAARIAISSATVALHMAMQCFIPSLVYPGKSTFA